MESVTETTQRAENGDNNNKRTCFAPTSAGQTAKPASYVKAKCTANVTHALLPSSIKLLAEQHVLSFLKLNVTLARLEKAKLKLADDPFIPLTLRISTLK